MLDGLLRIDIRFYGVMRLGLIEIDIQRPGLHGALAKNGILHASLSVINDVKDGCFGAVSMITLKVLEYFGRKSGDQSKKNHIEHELFLLLMVGYE
ncbi:hypothetical protein GJ744_006029 [Endocarpon pusillum]|uniref:Uncharacterized protein n=1 Tax=Endocarpon pusillum TaxID=364733 RepID=A0A8H7DY33_9EURO|nr:hypothetical protein GJ744_006029 [Endocarpon pusillum]